MSGLTDTPDLFDLDQDEWAALYGEQAQPDPEACGLHVITPTMPGAAALTPYDVPIPPSWRDPAKMAAAVREAGAALRTHPTTAQGPRITIFRAISRAISGSTVNRKTLSPDMMDALALGLGIAPKVRRRSEAMFVREQERYFDYEILDYEGMTQREIATDIGRTDRTVRRRMASRVGKTDWKDADSVIASLEEFVRHGAWDRRANPVLYDACLWFANRAKPLPVEAWWAIACAFGLAKGEHGTGCFTDKAIVAIWGAPTTNPAIVPEAAKLRASDESLSNRKLAEKLGVDDGVINRLANVTKMPNADTGMAVLAHAVWVEKIWTRWHSKA